MTHLLDDPDLVAVVQEARGESHPSVETLIAHFRRKLSTKEQERVTEHLVGCPSCRELRLGLPDVLYRSRWSPRRWARLGLHPAIAWSLALVIAGVLVAYALRLGLDRRGTDLPRTIQLVELTEDPAADDVLGAASERSVRSTAPAHLLLVTTRVDLKEPLPVVVASPDEETWRGVATPRSGYPGQFTTVLPALPEGEYRVLLQHEGEVLATFRFTVEALD